MIKLNFMTSDKMKSDISCFLSINQTYNDYGL